MLREALQKAKDLPRMPQFARHDVVPVPWPVASSKVYGGKVTRQQALEAPIEKVPLDQLHAVQRGVHRTKLVQYLLNGGHAPKGAESKSGYPRDLPIVVKTAGKLYVHDGHHRLTSQALMGARTAEARVVSITKHPLKRWADAV